MGGQLNLGGESRVVESAVHHCCAYRALNEHAPGDEGLAALFLIPSSDLIIVLVLFCQSFRAMPFG